MEFIVTDEQEFIKYEEAYPLSNFYQTTAWSKIKKSNGWNSHFTMIKDKDKIVGIALLLSKKIFLNLTLFYIPRGFITDYSNNEYVTFYTNNLKNYVKKNKGFMFKIDPLISYQERDNDSNIVENGSNNKVIVNTLNNLNYKHRGFTIGYTDEYQARWSYALHIKNKTIEELVDNMHTRAKRSIKKFEKYPLISKYLEDDLSDFKELMSHTCNRQKQPDRTLDYYKIMYDNLKIRDKIKILVIYLDKEKYLSIYNEEDPIYNLVKEENRNEIPIACGLFIMNNKTVNYVYGGAYDKYMKTMAQYKVQYDMIKYGIDNKHEIYDFGGITGNFDEESHAYGIYGFKRGFSGYVIEYIGEFDYIVNKFQYILYKILYRGFELIKQLKKKI